jgi:hypothetical protein
MDSCSWSKACHLSADLPPDQTCHLGCGCTVGTDKDRHPAEGFRALNALMASNPDYGAFRRCRHPFPLERSH